MMALTVMQPWAHAIMYLGKNIENRSWSVDYRGLLGIHAGKSRDRLVECDAEHCGRWLPLYGVRCPKIEDLDFGAMLGTVELVDCVPRSKVKDNPWADGPWCWILANPRPYAKPRPCSGKMALWPYNP